MNLYSSGSSRNSICICLSLTHTRTFAAVCSMNRSSSILRNRISLVSALCRYLSASARFFALSSLPIRKNSCISWGAGERVRTASNKGRGFGKFQENSTREGLNNCILFFFGWREWSASTWKSRRLVYSIALYSFGWPFYLDGRE